MSIILGECGCGCDDGGGCEKVTTNCNFVLRKYDNNTPSNISWNSEATEAEKECFASPYGCPGVLFDVLFSVCSGQGEVWRSGGGGGGGFCPIITDEGPTIYTVPCCSSDDLYQCASTLFYTIYTEGSTSNELYNGNFDYNGVNYTVSSGTLEAAPDPDADEETPATLMGAASSSEGISAMSSGVLLGTFSRSPEDESINFDNIGVLVLNDGDPANTCKFSYNFRFTPVDGVDYYVMSLPCSDTEGYASISLAQDGRAYFNAQYNETSKTCFISSTQVTAPETPSVPESQ
jgi:hypothetical protein